ncbi:MAG: hydroxymethylglutaryl-CoA synthase [Candidatus Peribacteraceae bacterium]|nr:hydroxymethylglutaryl-CoA synthase [Candidatus Peribacteraceae bacterium]
MSTPHSAIVGFGMEIPARRITVEEIAAHWGRNPKEITAGLGVREKAVASAEEDSFTLAFEAAQQAIRIAGIQSSEISAVYVGSESHPYAVKPTSGMLAAALDLHPFSFCADLEFACKAGTAGMQIVDALIRSGQITYGLAIGTDKAQSKPGDALEYTAAAGAAAFVMGPESAPNALARIEATLSFTTDTPDFWRSAHAPYPAHAGRFTGEPGYFLHVREALKGILETAKVKLAEIDHVILHMPNAKFPSRIAKEFKITKEQMQAGFIVPTIGNTYSACSPLGLAHVLQAARKGQRILLVSYGSGAGADAFLFTMLRDGVKLPFDAREIRYVSYGEYRRNYEEIPAH